MATEVTIKTDMEGELGSNLATKYADQRHTETFQVTIDVGTRITPFIHQLAVAASADFPDFGEPWPAAPFYGLYAKQFAWKPRNLLLTEWYCTVTYLPLEPNEPQSDGSSDNPLFYPATYELEWLDTEEKVTQAKNEHAMGLNAPGGLRAAMTVGPIVNSALFEFENGTYRNRRVPVIVIKKNVATWQEILAWEDRWGWTTNSNSVSGIAARKFMYLSVDSNGQQTKNGESYYQRTSHIALFKKTTDIIVSNIGFHYWNNQGGVKTLKRFTVTVEGEEQPSSEPHFLDNDTGDKSANDKITQLTFFDLDQVDYTELLNQ